MPGRIIGTVQAEDFPSELAAALSVRLVRGSSYRVTVEEIEATDEEKLTALRAAVQRGRDDIAAGRCAEGDEAFARLSQKHFPGRTK